MVGGKDWLATMPFRVSGLDKPGAAAKKFHESLMRGKLLAAVGRPKLPLSAVDPDTVLCTYRQVFQVSIGI